jgi:hypothetical protein
VDCSVNALELGSNLGKDTDYPDSHSPQANTGIVSQSDPNVFSPTFSLSTP